MADSKGGGSILPFFAIILFIHFFVGWEWLGDLVDNRSDEDKRRGLLLDLRQYESSPPKSIDPLALGAKVDTMTDVQLDKFEDSLRGSPISARGPIYDVQKSSSRFGLARFEVVVWEMSISKPRLPVRGTCIATNDREAAMIEGLSVGQEVKITGEVESVGRMKGVLLHNCVVTTGKG